MRMTSQLTIIGLLLAGPAAAPAEAAKPAAPEPTPGIIAIRHCTIEYEHSSSVGTSLLGILQDCLVRPGDRVKAGQVLGRLQDQEAQAELDLRIAEAES